MDFVTICFEKDWPQLRLQAASMRKHLRNFPLDRIKIIINGDLLYRTDLERYYGELWPRVDIIMGKELVDDPVVPCPWCKTHCPKCGYCNQQLLKIRAALACTADSYCILDAKNWLIRDWAATDRLPLFRGHIDEAQWGEHRLNSWQLFDLIPPSTSTIAQNTPCFLPTKLMQELAEDHRLAQWQDLPMAEFFIIDAWLHLKDSLGIYETKHTGPSIGIWPGWVDKFCDMTDLWKGNQLCAGIHRDSFGMLSDDQITQFVKYAASYIDDPDRLVDDMISLNPVIV